MIGSCSGTQYGCCEDGKTPAGPNQINCDSKSKKNNDLSRLSLKYLDFKTKLIEFIKNDIICINEIKNKKIDINDLLNKFFIKIIKNSNKRLFNNIGVINNLEDVFINNTDTIKEILLNEFINHLDNSKCSQVLNVIPLGETIDKIFLEIANNLNNYWAHKAKKMFDEPGYKYVMEFPIKDREKAYLELIKSKNFVYKLETDKYNFDLYDNGKDNNNSLLYDNNFENTNNIVGHIDKFTNYVSKKDLFKDLYLNKNDMKKLKIVLSKYINEDEICKKKIIENKNLLEHIEIMVENYLHHNLDKDPKLKLIDKVLNIIGDMPNCSILLNDIINNNNSIIKDNKNNTDFEADSEIKTQNKYKKKVNSNLHLKDCSCRGPDYRYNSEKNSCWNKKTGDSIDVCLPYERKIVNIKSNKEYNPKEELLYKIKDVKEKYWLSNDECSNKMKDINYVNRFIKGYSLYLNEGFKKTLGYVPNNKNENNLSLTELRSLYNLLNNLPKCNDIINLNINNNIVNNSNFKTLFDPIYNKLDKMDKKLSDIENNLEDNVDEPVNYFQSSDAKSFDLMSHNKEDNVRIKEEYSNGDYTPQYEFNHNEPSKTIASAYGWSYIPPQFWSVPQKRPPVCIPNKDSISKVCPTIEKGVPIGALSMTEVGSILPKFEYKEIYNPDYYYPGWISQDKINYPNKNGTFSSEYYNYNKAEKI